MYVENNGNSILGYNIATHAQVFTLPASHSPDGTGVISGGLFNGYVIANNNDGTVSLIDPTGTTADHHCQRRYARRLHFAGHE